MNRYIMKIIVILAVACAIMPETAYAMGTVPPPPPGTVEIIPTATGEALAKEQIENLKNISISSVNVEEGYGNIVRQMMSGKKYLYEFNSIAKDQLLKDALDKKQDYKYRFAILGTINPNIYPEMQDVQIKILQDKTERKGLRMYAAQGIRGIGTAEDKERAVAALIEALKDDDWYIVADAANGLGRIKDKKAVAPLIESVKRCRKNIDELLENKWKGYEGGTPPEEAALSTSIRALGNIGDERAVPVLIDMLNDQYLEKVVEMNDGTKGWAIIALRDIGDKRAIEPIRKYLQTTKDFRVGEVGHAALKKLTSNISDEKGNAK